MIDKIIMLKATEITVIYNHKLPVTVSSDNICPLELFAWLTTPTVIRLNEWKQAVSSADEFTQEIAA